MKIIEKKEQKCYKPGCENDAPHVLRQNFVAGKFYVKVCEYHYQRAAKRERNAGIILSVLGLIFIVIFIVVTLWVIFKY